MFNIRNAYERINCAVTRRRHRAIAVYYVTQLSTGQRCKVVSFDPNDK